MRLHQFGRGTPVNRSSSNFIIGFLSADPSYIYLQRGYRHYGNPLVISFPKVRGINLDDH